MTYLCSQEILAASQTASFFRVCVLILEHLRLIVGPRKSMGRNVEIIGYFAKSA